MTLDDLAELTLVEFQGVSTIFITLGGLYKSLSLICTITFSYWTYRGFEKKLVKDLQEMDPDLYKSQTEEQILCKLKNTITVDNQFHRSYQMKNIEERLKSTEE